MVNYNSPIQMPSFNNNGNEKLAAEYNKEINSIFSALNQQAAPVADASRRELKEKREWIKKEKEAKRKRYYQGHQNYYQNQSYHPQKEYDVPKMSFKNMRYVIINSNSFLNQLACIKSANARSKGQEAHPLTTDEMHAAGWYKTLSYEKTTVYLGRDDQWTTQTSQIVDYINFELMKHRQELDKPISFSLNEMMDMMGWTNLRRAREIVKETLDMLVRAQYSYYNDRTQKPFFMRLFSHAEYKLRVITIHPTPMIVNMYKPGHSYHTMLYPKELLKLNGYRNGAEYYMIRKLYCNKRINAGKAQENRIRIKTLLDWTPTIDVKNSKRAKRSIFKAVHDMIETLMQAKLIKSVKNSDDNKPFSVPDNIRSGQYMTIDLLDTTLEFEFADDFIAAKPKGKWKKQSKKTKPKPKTEKQS